MQSSCIRHRKRSGVSRRSARRMSWTPSRRARVQHPASSAAADAPDAQAQLCNAARGPPSARSARGAHIGCRTAACACLQRLVAAAVTVLSPRPTPRRKVAWQRGAQPRSACERCAARDLHATSVRSCAQRKQDSVQPPQRPACSAHGRRSSASADRQRPHSAPRCALAARRASHTPWPRVRQQAAAGGSLSAPQQPAC